MSTESHTMVIMKTYGSGAEEWYCPNCGRRFVIQWPPEYKRIILEQGDEQAMHNAGTGGVQMGQAQVEQPAMQLPPQATPPDDLHTGESLDSGSHDDRYLGPWENFMNDLKL